VCRIYVRIREAIIVVGIRQRAGKDSPKGRPSPARVSLEERDAPLHVQHIDAMVDAPLLDVSLNTTNG
jgi:hypothetical protein